LRELEIELAIPALARLAIWPLLASLRTQNQVKWGTRLYRTENPFESSKEFSVYADRAGALADLLAMHEDVKKVYGDLVSAEKMSADE